MAEPTIQLGGGNWAGKTDNLLGYYKEGERFYKQDFTFSRSTTGTYTDSDGYIQEMPYNKLTNSNDFSNAAWVKDRCTLTSGQSGYDGSNDAWLIQSTATSASARCYQAFNSDGNFNRSVYAKKGTSDYLAIYTTSSAYAYFNLSNGTIGTESNNVNASILSVGNGWYRCSVTMSNVYDNHYIFVANVDNNTSTNSGDNIYIQDAQLNKGTSAKTYFPTTTRLNMPRVDYLNNSNGSLILEPQRTNLLNYSTDFSQWGNARTTDTANQITSPDGLNNGTLLEQQSGQTNAGSIYFSVSLSSGTYAQSIFAKKKDKDFIVCYSANAERTYFNLSNGTIGTIASGNTAKIEDYGNGWYRCTITYTITSGSNIAFYLSDSDNSKVVTDSGGVYIYGAQVEAGSYATSYIPTSGSSVTRNADVCSISNVADRINSSEGVLYFEGSALADDGTNRWAVALSDGSNNERVQIIYFSDNSISSSVVSSNTSQCSFNYSGVSATDFNKIAISYKQNDFKMYVNGTLIDSDTSGSVPTGLDTLGLERPTGVSQFHGNVKDVRVYSTALTDSELQALTTL